MRQHTGMHELVDEYRDTHQVLWPAAPVRAPMAQSSAPRSSMHARQL